jgi:hypothetical protein
VEDAAVAVEGVGMGVDSPSEISQEHYLASKSGEVGACKDLEGNVFTIGSGNKGKVGDMLHTSKEKFALYIGTNSGLMHVRSGSLKSNWCCRSPHILTRSPPILTQY